jgi:hypothetical protein
LAKNNKEKLTFSFHFRFQRMGKTEGKIVMVWVGWDVSYGLPVFFWRVSPLITRALRLG